MAEFQLRAIQRKEFLVRATVVADSVDDIDPEGIRWEEENALGDYSDIVWLDSDSTFADEQPVEQEIADALVDRLRIDCPEEIVAELVKWGRENNQLHHEVFQRAMHYLAIED
jgi:hypothetical protein